MRGLPGGSSLLAALCGFHHCCAMSAAAPALHPPRSWRDDPLIAFAGPFVIFMLGLMLVSLVKAKEGSLWLTHPEYWVYPLQTVACAVALGFWWRNYSFRPLDVRAVGVGLAMGIFVFVLWVWISPPYLQPVFDFLFSPFLAPAVREGGFDPTLLESNPPLYFATLAFRLARLVIVVPLLEELFWRGFLLRYFVREDFTTVPMGSANPLSFVVVSLAFMLAHSRPDWPAAFLTGALYNLVAIYTRSLGACVLAHALTNLLLGSYILATKQWGFW